MDKSSSKKRKKSRRRSHSCSSSSEDDKYKTKPHLKEEKQEILTRKSEPKRFKEKASHAGTDRGECFDDKVEKSKNKEKRERRKREHTDSGSSSSSALASEPERKKSKKSRKKEAKRQKKEKRRKDKKDKQKKRKKRRKEKENGSSLKVTAKNEDAVSGPMPEQLVIPQAAVTEPKKRQPMVPMTKEEYEKQQSKVRRVFDPETGRNRLVKGDGEIIEEVVSYQRHKEINKLATMGDGASFQKSLGLHK